MRPAPDETAAAGAAGGGTRPELPRSLSLITATAIVIGSVIGSGIFKKTAVMSDALPSPAMVLGIWAVAGLITFLGALSAAELGSTFPESGGLYAHFRNVFGRFPAYLYGWATLAVIQTGSIASVAYVFAQYLNYFVGWDTGPSAWHDWGATLFGTIDLYPLRELSTKLVAVACIAVVTVLNVLDVRFGAAVQNLFTGGKLLAVAAIIAIACFGAGDFGHVSGPAVVPPGLSAGGLAAAITLALSGAFWAYDGWINVTYVGGELKRPDRDLPRSLGVGLLVVVVVYMVVNAAYFYLLPVDDVRSSTLVAADALDRVIPVGAAFVSAAVIVSTFGTVNGMALTSARVYFAMSRDGLFAASLARIHPVRRTPHVSLIVQGFWASALVFSGTFDQITDMLIFVSWAFYGLLALAVIVARVRFPDRPRPYRVPGYPWVPGVFVAFSAAYVLQSIVVNTRNAAFGSLLVAIGVPLYFALRRRRPAAPAAG